MKDFLRLQFLSWRSLFIAIRDLGRRFPWVAIAIVITAATITTLVQIGTARAERDKAQHQWAEVQNELTTLREFYHSKQ